MKTKQQNIKNKKDTKTNIMIKGAIVENYTYIEIITRKQSTKKGTN